MGRLPFNARRDRSDSTPAESSAKARPLSVRSLASMIDGAIRGGLPAQVSVEGEVSGFRHRTHWYFDLKDTDAVVSCVVFASAAARLQPIENGDSVLVRGRVEFYAKAGKVSLIATRVEHVGQGQQDAALRRLIEELRELGWLDPERKRRLPPFPSRVAVVTSRSAAALQDVLATLRRRCPMLRVLLADAPVQGDAAAAAVAARIDALSSNAADLGLDAIIVTRGGGSAEDLAAFNDRTVARAIVESSVPVVAAIGHETDTTVAELVADVRAATPTQAAVLVSPDVDAVNEMLEMHRSRLSFAVTRAVTRHGTSLEAAAASLARAGGKRLMGNRRDHFAEAAARLHRAMADASTPRHRAVERLELRLSAARPDRQIAKRHARQSSSLAAASARLRAAIRAKLIEAQRRAAASARELHAVGPAEVLRRGYSVTLDSGGKVLRSVADAPPGSKIETRLADVSVGSVVGGTPSRGRIARKQGPRPARDQLDLFDRAE